MPVNYCKPYARGDMNFSGATLVGIQLLGADLIGANLTDADLENANLDVGLFNPG